VVSSRTRGVAVDPIDRKLYWGHLTDDGLNSIRRANLNGSSPELLYDLSYFYSVWSIALDRTRGKLYISLYDELGCLGIYRFEMNGVGDYDDGVTVLPDACADGVAIDSGAAKIYWSGSYLTDNGVFRSDLDGTQIQTVITTDEFARGVSLDPARNMLYWAHWHGPNIVVRAGLDGSNQEVLVAGDYNHSPGLALDLQGDGLYYSFSPIGECTVRRAELDGSNPETILELCSSGQIAIDPVPNGVDVPATSVTGLVVLLLVLLGVSIMARRRNHPADRTGRAPAD